MSEPIWLNREIVLSMHTALLARFGGLEGVRDEGLLDSAINRPQQLHHYEDPSLFALAAAYGSGPVKNHPFLDGNKRIGFMSAYTFLGANGYKLESPEEEAVIMTRDLAAGIATEQEYAAWLERSCTKR